MTSASTSPLPWRSIRWPSTSSNLKVTAGHKSGDFSEMVVGGAEVEIKGLHAETYQRVSGEIMMSGREEDKKGRGEMTTE